MNRLTLLATIILLSFGAAKAQEPNTKLAEFGAQLERLEAALQSVQGTGETQAVQIKQLEDKIERNYRDLEMRLKALEGKINLFQDILNRMVANVAPKLAEEGKKFQQGLNLVQAGEYTKAIPLFQQFIQQYPKSPQVAEAYFWIADCRYASRDYAQAIKDFQKFVEKNPKSSKAPTAVLKQGDAFMFLQMPEEAKVFYKKLVGEYPSTEEAAQALGKLTALAQKGEVLTTLPPPPPKKSTEPADF